jgi:hypothetical protein
MSALAVDHLVVAADSLAQGVAWCESMLGVTPGPGGNHALFGTHNRLLKLTGPRFPQAYLEIIAIDPAAPPPGRARWFGLDDPALQARVSAAPRLIHLVARADSLRPIVQALRDAGHEPGDAVRASRGALSWQIVLRADGTLPCGGALPTLIQWDGPHPTDTMPDAGLSLQGLALRGLAPRVRELLALPGVDMLGAPGPALRANLSTPRGEVILES